MPLSDYLGDNRPFFSLLMKLIVIFIITNNAFLSKCFSSFCVIIFNKPIDKKEEIYYYCFIKIEEV